MTVAKRQASTGRVVLAKASSKAGGKTIRSVDQLLTSNQRKVLRNDFPRWRVVVARLRLRRAR